MKFLPKNILSLLSLSSMLMFTACSSPHVLSTSSQHLYNHNYGLVQSSEADAQLQQELLFLSQQIIDMPIITDPELTTELVMDPDAFYAEDYVQVAPVITYKYKFDPEFYDKAEWRKMDLQ